MDNLTGGHFSTASSDLIEAANALLSPDPNTGRTTLNGHSYGSEIIVNTAFNGGLGRDKFDVNLYSSPVSAPTSFLALELSGVHVNTYSINPFDVANIYSPAIFNPAQIIGGVLGLLNAGGNHANYPYNNRAP